MSERWKNVLSVLALVVGLLVALALAVWGFLLGFCSLFGEECSSSEETMSGLFFLASLGVFAGVPAVVAAWRRQAWWLLAPVIEVVLVLGFFGVLDAF